ncbi:MAG: TolC family protein [Acidobacteriota bacterium]
MFSASTRPGARANSRVFSFAGLGFLFGFCAAGQAPDRPVSLEEAVRIARDRAPEIAAARARVLQAEGRKFAASVPADPELQYGLGRGRPRDGGPSRKESTVELRQFLTSPLAVRSRLRSGEAEIEASLRDVDVAASEAVLQVKRIYYEAAISGEEANALAEAATDARALQDVMDRRVEVGEASEGDRLRTRVEALRADLEARSALAQAEAAKAALGRFLLGSLGPRFILSTALDPTSIPDLGPDFLEQAVGRNPELRAARSRLEAAGWSLSAEKAQRIPGLSLSSFWLTELDRRASGVTLGLSIPLWNRNQGAIRVAQGERAEAEADVLAVRTEVEIELERAIRANRSARELAIAYRKEILPAASEALSIVRFSLGEGEANLLSWLEARRSYLEILRASYRAQLEAFLKRAELERIVGGIDVSL